MENRDCEIQLTAKQRKTDQLFPVFEHWEEIYTYVRVENEVLTGQFSRNETIINLRNKNYIIIVYFLAHL
jgi:hypothetical protein